MNGDALKMISDREIVRVIVDRKVVYGDLGDTLREAERLKREALNLDDRLRALLTRHGAVAHHGTVYRIDPVNRAMIEEIPVKTIDGRLRPAPDDPDDSPSPNTTAEAIPEAAGAVS